MVAAANLVEIAALVGDTTRATVLNAPMGGQALTTNELAAIAGVAKSTMSEHLSRLERAGLVSSAVHRQFKYYRIALPRVAAMMGSIKVVAAIDCPPRYQPKSANADAIRSARTCYDHSPAASVSRSLMPSSRAISLN
jgi:DNA-binding transcriptional ArsR family regulator